MRFFYVAAAWALLVLGISAEAQERYGEFQQESDYKCQVKQEDRTEKGTIAQLDGAVASDNERRPEAREGR